MATTATQDQQQPAQPRKISLRKASDADSERTWLETVLKEKKAQKEWGKKWGFTLEILKERDEKIAKLERPRHRMNKIKEFKAKVELQAEPSPPLPVTSSAIVGLRCSSEYWLENFGPLYVSPRLTIEPPADSRLDSDEEQQYDADHTVNMKLDQRRSGLYTTSVILLK